MLKIFNENMIERVRFASIADQSFLAVSMQDHVPNMIKLISVNYNLELQCRATVALPIHIRMHGEIIVSSANCESMALISL